MWSRYAFIAVTALLAVAFFAPVPPHLAHRKDEAERKRRFIHLSLYKRCLCVLLAYVNIIVTTEAGENGEIITKAVGWTVDDGNLPVVGNELSYSITEYDAAGRVGMTISLDEDGYEQPTSYEYDKSGRQTAIIDPCGHTINYVQDGDWYVIDTVSLNGTHKTITHYTGTHRDSVTDANGQTTGFTYDALGRIIKTTYPATSQNPVTYIYVGYDGLGRKACESKQTAKTLAQLTNEDIKEYEYDTGGRLSAVILAEDEMERPDHNDIIITARPRNEYVYDDYGNLIESWDNIYEEGVNKISVYERGTIFTYNELNLQTSRELANSDREYKFYDDFGRISVDIDFKEQATGYFYNSRGQLRYKRYYEADGTAGGGNTNYPDTWVQQVEYTYDNPGRKTQEVETNNPLTYTRTTTYHYDTEGRMIVVGSPEGYVRYVYSDITGRKTQTRSYAVTADLEDDVLALSNNDITRVQYTYDEIGRLYETKTLKRDGNTLAAPEVTANTYDEAGNRQTRYLANNVTAGYTYDSLNRLTNLANTHSVNGVLSSFGYTLYPDGMRHTVTETLKTSASITETHNITYTYDNLSRLTSEDANCSSPTGSYSEEYTFDVVGNRTYREVIANGQLLQTDYYYDGTDASVDMLSREVHTGPVACVPVGDERYYAYAGGSGISYRTSDGSPVGKIKAFMLGLPNEAARYMLAFVLICVPVTFLLPIINHGLTRIFTDYFGQKKTQKANNHRLRRLLRQGLIILLAYLMLIQPGWMESVAEASSQYNQITTSNWAAHKYVEYTYDANGSCINKTTKDSTNAIVEAVQYDYNLQNKLERITKEYEEIGNNIYEVTEYIYNDEGIRVKSVYRKYVNDIEQTGSRETTVFLVDSYNHTGFAQVLEETLYNYAGAFVYRRTYTVGDDVLTQSRYNVTTTGIRHLLYDGQGSTRQLTDNSGNVAPNQVYNYDAYGVLLGYSGTLRTNLLYAGEWFDTNIRMYNLRARWYNPTNGLFNQMDSFAGSSQDPQSLHKYLYCHANPVNAVDPSGNIIIRPSIKRLIIAFGVAKAISILVGIRATYVLGDAYIKETLADKDEVAINKWIELKSKMSPKEWVKEFMLRPDIVDNDRRTVYEVKRDRPEYIAEAQTKITTRYIPALTLRHGCPYTPGTWQPLERVYSVVGLPGIVGLPIINIIARNAGGGVIAYEPSPNEESIVWSVVIADVGIQVARAIQFDQARLQGETARATMISMLLGF